MKDSVSSSPQHIVAPPEPRVIEGTRDAERIPTVVVRDHDTVSQLVADRIIEAIRRETEVRGRCVLGLATGSTPIGIYNELIRRYEAGEVDFSHVVTFNLDEYYPMAPERHNSYRRYMWENLFAHINMDPKNIHIPDGTAERDVMGTACTAYENTIVEAGGIDLQLLGIGRSGHIGFNEPGSPQDSRTRLISLDSVTRRDAAADFFGEENVPREAVTMGVATILEAREIILLATGEHKASIAQRAIEGEVSPTVAATFLQRHPNTTVYLDLPAAAELTRIKTPWMLENVDWSPTMTERAVVWLAERTNKAILKLTARDYADHHLSPLLAKYGTPGPINGEVFNQLNDKIRGRSKLPAGKRILVFSPHPDDDVISMGGILRKLRQNENSIVLAYMTSGNIAVFDHEVRRYLDFVERAAEPVGLDAGTVRATRQRINEVLERKQPGDVDPTILQDLKRFVRESEAVSALASVGLPSSAALFLNMPFYRTGEVRKRPIGEADIAIVEQLLKEAHPDVVFVAGDLSDPHGTHRMCRAAIDHALARVPQIQPEIWLYRGAWQEWSLTEADVVVPLSQNELHHKVLAIFRHESQKDTAPFPGAIDDREFWQRVEARNRETAALADRLGLPEYFAMEAYRLQAPPAAPTRDGA